MRLQRIALTGTLLGILFALPVDASAQGAADQIRQLVEAARDAAGQEHAFLLSGLCAGPMRAVNAAPVELGDFPRALPATDPEREWYTEPVQVFDDLFYLGQTAFSVWGLRTSDGIILVDAIFDYSVEAEVIGGLEKLGIDPDEIRYVIISHAHGDHSAGAGILQQYGARVVMSEADWDLYERTGREAVKATRDIVATDGMEIRLGDSTVRVYLTPGHTNGTISTVMPVHDNGEPHVAAIWGGTAFNFRDSPEDPRDGRLQDYAESASRFSEIVTEAGADIMLSNHPTYDGSTVKIPMLAERGPGAANPFVIGTESVVRYLSVAQSCAEATRISERPAVVF
jgi:metallo-beta-lactamase class B